MANSIDVQIEGVIIPPQDHDDYERGAAFFRNYLGVEEIDAEAAYIAAAQVLSVPIHRSTSNLLYMRMDIGAWVALPESVKDQL